MKWIAVIAVALLNVGGFCQPAFAQLSPDTPNQPAIKSMVKSTKFAVNRATKVHESLATLEVTYKSPSGQHTGAVAYFFDDQGQVVATREPMSGFPKGHPTVVFQADNQPRWAHIVVVLTFPDSAAVAACYPQDDITRYNFPNKEDVLKGRGAAAR